MNMKIAPHPAMHSPALSQSEYQRVSSLCIGPAVDRQQLLLTITVTHTLRPVSHKVTQVEQLEKISRYGLHTGTRSGKFQGDQAHQRTGADDRQPIPPHMTTISAVPVYEVYYLGNLLLTGTREISGPWNSASQVIPDTTATGFWYFRSVCPAPARRHYIFFSTSSHACPKVAEGI